MKEEKCSEDEYLLNRLYRRYIDKDSIDEAMDKDELIDQSDEVLRQFKRKMKVNAAKALTKAHAFIIDNILEVNTRVNNEYLEDLGEEEYYQDREFYKSINFLSKYIDTYDYYDDEEYYGDIYPIHKYDLKDYARIEEHIDIVSHHFPQKAKHIQKQIFKQRKTFMKSELKFYLQKIAKHKTYTAKNYRMPSYWLESMGKLYYEAHTIKKLQLKREPNYSGKKEAKLMKKISMTLDAYYPTQKKPYKNYVLVKKLETDGMIYNLNYQN